jgi:hypothetical protein
MMTGTISLQTKGAQVQVSTDILSAAGLDPNREYLMREAVVASNQVDRDFERFDNDVLEDFARTIVGKSLLIGHRHDAVGEGIWVDAHVATSGDYAELRATFAIPIGESDANRDLREKVESGVARYISIGFCAGDLTCDVCGESLFSGTCQHWPGRKTPEGAVVTATWHGPGDAVEGSIVYLGSQYEGAIKGLPWDNETPTLACCGKHRVKHAAPGGEMVLSERDLVCAAVRIAGARGDDGLDDAGRRSAWLEVERDYRLAGRKLPAWTPGDRFDWSHFTEEDRREWFSQELETECACLAGTLVGRIKGARAQLGEKDGPLPPALTDALAPLTELLRPLPLESGVDGAKVGAVLSRRNRDLVQAAVDALSALIAAADGPGDEESADKAASTDDEPSGPDPHDTIIASLLAVARQREAEGGQAPRSLAGLLSA